MAITKTIRNLPATIEGLKEFIIVGKAAVEQLKLKIKAINKIERANNAVSATLEDAQDIAEAVIYAEVRLGELLKAIPNKKASSGAGTRSLPKDINKKDSHLAQSLANNPEIVEKTIAEAREVETIPTARDVLKNIDNEKKVASTPHVALATGENEWYTPQHIVEKARQVMGEIHCDPASSKQANETIKAKTYYTKDDNGLKKKWEKTVWMNPPYAQPLITQFSETIVSKYNSGEFNQACILVNNATETVWFQDMLLISTAICYIMSYLTLTKTKGGRHENG